MLILLPDFEQTQKLLALPTVICILFIIETSAAMLKSCMPYRRMMVRLGTRVKLQLTRLIILRPQNNRTLLYVWIRKIIFMLYGRVVIQAMVAIKKSDISNIPVE